ncbi:MAG TPA: hypothetical protein VMU74_03130 [Gaiellaceae bacterium]|nr:hypothetical protein [Gaiellaceae bacterium]
MPHLPGFRRASAEAVPSARAVPPVGRLRRQRRELLIERCGELVRAAVLAGARFFARCGRPLEAQ